MPYVATAIAPVSLTRWRCISFVQNSTTERPSDGCTIRDHPPLPATLVSDRKRHRPGGCPSMKILIDASTHGSGGYVAHLKGILGPGRIPADMRVTIACSFRLASALQPCDAGLRIVQVPMLGKSVAHQFLWRELFLGRLLASENPDIVFAPAGLLRLVSGYRRIPTVVMCQYIIPFLDAEIRRISKASRARWRSALLRQVQLRSFQRAAGTIFLSAHSERTVRGLGVRLNRTAIIPHGVGDSYRTPPRISRETPFRNILYVSTIDLYKNQWHVADAITKVRAETGLDLHLQLVGSELSPARDRLRTTLARLGHPEWIHLMGWQDEERVRQLLREASAFVFASSAETFGISLLEAMASGLPIACSNRQPMTEILRDAGLYFDPESPSSIAQAIRELVENPDTSQCLAAKAYTYAQDYSWARCATETFNFLRQVWQQSPT